MKIQTEKRRHIRSTGPFDGAAPYLAAATEIGRELIRQAKVTSEGPMWNGDDLVGQSDTDPRLTQGPVGCGLYSGGAGIAWFLAHLGTVSNEKTFIRAAVSASEIALTAAAQSLNHETISLFTGATGVALATMEISTKLRHAGLRRASIGLARAVAEQVNAGELPEASDLIGGVAGVIIGLLAIHRLAPDRLLLQACERGCRELVKRKRTEWWGCSWPESNLPDSSPGLCGLAHGASGIGWALTETASATGESEFDLVANDAFLYERSWYSSERCAWPDLRNAPSSDAANWPSWTVAWCHGALGIGAVRLRRYELTRDAAALAEAGAALHAARLMVSAAGENLRAGRLSDVTLCHGLGGAAELMLLAYEVTALQDHRRAARRVGDLCLDIYRANRSKWTCGLHGAENVPGLFVGRAGIGVTMLRLHEDSLIQSPLLPGRSAFHEEAPHPPALRRKSPGI